MLEFYAAKTQLTLRRREPLTSGSVNVYPVRFEFSPDWEGLERTAVFRGGGEPVSVRLDETNQCEIPWEALAQSGQHLRVGVYGTRGSDIVLPTVWAGAGYILEGVRPGEIARPPTPELWEQELDRKADALKYTESGELGLYAGDTLLSVVPAVAGGAGIAADEEVDEMLEEVFGTVETPPEDVASDAEISEMLNEVFDNLAQQD